MKLSLQWKWFGTLALLLGALLLVVNLCFDLAVLPLEENIRQDVEGAVASASFMVALLALPVAFWLARRFSGPIEGMRQMATRVAEGDFALQAPTHIRGELSDLGNSLNRMAGLLETRLQELTKERADLQATLANMIEGVLLVDAGGRILLANRALQRQFQLTDEVKGKTVMEVFRNTNLSDVVAEGLHGNQVNERELSFFNQGERIFAVNAASLGGMDVSRKGAVVVFHDITRLQQLENMRKEFVANVSHELRTPLSIIKGYVETLLDEPAPDREMAKQFLRTIQKHSLRLEALIADLLTISALESQKATLTFESVSLRRVAEAVTDELVSQARSRSIFVSLEAAEALPMVRADANRLHQALFNLLDNAVKYIQTGGRVTISAVQKGGEVEICVADNGPGISPEHIPHIFERFYRVDRARSRELGGTGLGLSIVKHVAQAHGGRVWAESEWGKGSSFFFTLPSGAQHVPKS